MTITRAAASRRPAAPSDLPTISGHHDALDGIRAVAAFAVLLLHVAADTGQTLKPGAMGLLYSGGAIGVPVFFTLSGMLLYRPWVADLLSGRPRTRTRTYLWRRALRILPAYWAVVAYVIIALLTSHAADPGTWLRLLTLTYTYPPHPWWGTALGPEALGQIWSLTVEVAWYALLPLTAAALAWFARRGENEEADGSVDVDRRARRALIGLAIYSALSFVYTIFLFVPTYRPELGIWLPRFLPWFAIGMALSIVSAWARTGAAAPARFCRTITQSWGICWAIAAVLYCMAASPLSGPSNLVTPDVAWTSELRLVLYGLVAAFFVGPVALAPADHPVIHPILGNGVMRFLGRISYGVFLWQMAVSVSWYNQTGHIPFHGNLLTEFPVIATFTVAVATLSYYLVEKPALWLGHRRRR